MEKIIIGIDLGGTNLRIGAVDRTNEMKAPQVIRSAVIADAEQPVRMLCRIIEEYAEKNGFDRIEAISAGVPSSVSNDKETVICTTNIRNSAGKGVIGAAIFARSRLARSGVMAAAAC